MLWHPQAHFIKEHKENIQRWKTMQKIFISYSRKDTDFVRKLAGDLEKAGYDVWWDITDLQGGDDWVRAIPDAIASSQYVIVVLTPNSVESEWVKKEYTQALNLHKKIIPVMLAPTTAPFALNTINFVNFTTGEYADNFKKLLSPLGYTGEPPEVSAFTQRTLASLPPVLIKYGIPVIVGFIIVLAFILIPRINPPQTPTVTPSPPPAATATMTSTLEISTATVSPTDTATATETITLTPTATWTASPTLFYEIRLPLYIVAESSNIFVRSGPGQTYVAKVLDLRDDSGKRLNVRPWFSAQIENEGYIWLLVARAQEDTTLREFEGGWIRRDLLEKNISIEILPVITLTATPTPSVTPTLTPTFTRTFTPTPTDTPTLTPTHTPTETLSPTDTETPTDTPTP